MRPDTKSKYGTQSLSCTRHCVSFYWVACGPVKIMSRFFVTRRLDLYKVYQNIRWKGYDNLDDSRVPHLQRWFKATLKRSFALHSIFHFFLTLSNSPSCGADFGGGGGKVPTFWPWIFHWKPKQVFCIVYSRIRRSNKPSVENIRAAQPYVRVYTFFLNVILVLRVN